MSMSMSSTTASSSSAASTSTSSASPTPTQSKSSGFFSAGGSPALVLAFLAIGIFVGGLISMLFLRRLALRHFFRRSWTREGDAWEPEWTTMLAGDGEGRSRRRRRLGEKPKLWDICGAALSVQRSARGWEYMRPLSAAYDQKEPPQLDVQDYSISAEPVHPPSQLASLFRWTRRPTRPPSPPLPPQPPDYGSTQGILQVGVAIVMPLQRDGSSRHPEGAAEVPVYELGFVDFPWSDRKHDLCEPEPKVEQGLESGQSAV